MAVISVLAVAVLASFRNTFELLGEKAELSIGLVEARVRGHLDPAVDQLAFLASLEEAGAVDPGDTDDLIGLFAGATAAAPQVLAIVRIGTDMQMIGIGREGDELEPLQQELRGDPQVVEAFDRLRASTGPYWGDLIFIDSEATSAVNLRYPVRRDSRLTAMLVAPVSVDELSRLLVRIGENDQTGTPFILYGTDSVLAHPTFVDTPPTMTADRLVPPLAEAGDRVLAALWSGGEDFRVTPGGVRARSIDIGDGEHMVLYRRLEGYAAEPLTLGIHYPEGTIAEPMERLVGSSALGVLLMLVAVVAGVMLGRRIARPIIHLAEQATTLAHRLEFGSTQDLPPSRITELDDQIGAFNRLLHGLRWLEPYVPRQLVRRLARFGPSAGLPSVERDLTVMFTDVVGFTSAAEHLPASQTAAFLNEHFALLGGCVEAEGGTIDKFIGDALMAFWGAPERQHDHPARACRAALAIAETVRTDNARRREAGRPAVRLRVGIHTGRMVVGDIGAPGRMNYTIVGDAVNIGNRLEELGKLLAPDEDVVVLLSGETAGRLGGDFPLKPLGPQPVRGRAEAIMVYRLV